MNSSTPVCKCTHATLLLLEKKCVCENQSKEEPITRVVVTKPWTDIFDLKDLAWFAIKELKDKYPRLFNTVRYNIIHSSITGTIAITAVPYESSYISENNNDAIIRNSGCSLCLTVSSPSDYLFAGFLIQYLYAVKGCDAIGLILSSRHTSASINKEKEVGCNVTPDIIAFLKTAHRVYLTYTYRDSSGSSNLRCK